MHSHSEHCGHATTGILTKALIVTAAFMVVEIVVGLYANSLALLADSAHMATDVASLAISLMVSWVALKVRTPKMSFGYHRAEVLGGIFSGMMVWVLGGVLIYESYERFFEPRQVQAVWVIAVSSLGLLVNLYGMRLLHGAQEKHLHVRGAYLHLLGDLLGSVGAILSGVLIYWTGLVWFDSLISVLFALLVLASATRLIWESSGILMQATPNEVDTQKLSEELERLPGLLGVHDLHVWAMTPGRLNASAHLVCKKDVDLRRATEIRSLAQEVLHKHYEIHHTTFQLEFEGQNTDQPCGNCR
jgi:cobalt-zinc-cadmium efflux system protein